jgi:hypothetical protein
MLRHWQYSGETCRQNDHPATRFDVPRGRGLTFTSPPVTVPHLLADAAGSILLGIDRRPPPPEPSRPVRQRLSVASSTIRISPAFSVLIRETANPMEESLKRAKERRRVTAMICREVLGRAANSKAKQSAHSATGPRRPV